MHDLDLPVDRVLDVFASCRRTPRRGPWRGRPDGTEPYLSLTDLPVAVASRRLTHRRRLASSCIPLPYFPPGSGRRWSTFLGAAGCVEWRDERRRGSLLETRGKPKRGPTRRTAARNNGPPERWSGTPPADGDNSRWSRCASSRGSSEYDDALEKEVWQGAHRPRPGGEEQRHTWAPVEIGRASCRERVSDQV